MSNNTTPYRPSSQLPITVSPSTVKSTPLKNNSVYPNSQDQNERNRFQFYRVGKLTKQLEATAWLIDD